MELKIYLAFRSIGVSEEGAARIARMSRQYVNWAVDRALGHSTPDAQACLPLRNTVVDELVSAGVALPAASRVRDAMVRHILHEAASRTAGARGMLTTSPASGSSSSPGEASMPTH